MENLVFKIRRFVPKDVEQVRELVLESFREFIAPSCETKGVQEFEKFCFAEKFLEKAKKCDVFVAEESKKIVGVVGREKDRIFSLFVDKRFHGRGIASSLLKKMERSALADGFSTMKIRSSLYALGFYQKQGYKKSTGVFRSKGIVFQPVIKRFK